MEFKEVEDDDIGFEEGLLFKEEKEKMFSFVFSENCEGIFLDFRGSEKDDGYGESFGSVSVESSYFFVYLVIVVIFVVVFYIVYYNKWKIIVFVLEGKRFKVIWWLKVSDY